MRLKHLRLLGYVCTSAFVWVTVEILRSDPERRMMVLWFLVGAALIGVCVAGYRCARDEQQRESDVVATVDRIRSVRSLDQ